MNLTLAIEKEGRQTAVADFVQESKFSFLAVSK
jgi:hypothetical protein